MAAASFERVTVIAFRNGTVYRGRGIPSVDRLMTDDGVIVDGDDRAVDEEVDLGGGFLCAAFGDGHAHPILAGREVLGPSIRAEDSVSGIARAVKEWADAHPDAEVILGGSYDATLAAEGLFDARWLDEAVSDRPVILRAWDYHTVWCNSAALDRAGITAETRDPVDGIISRRPDGSPLGTLLEWGAVDLVMQLVPDITIADGVEALRFATQTLAENGITWVQDAWVEPRDLDIWLAAAAAGALHCRADLAFRADPVRWDAQRHEVDGLRSRVDGVDLLTANTIKFFVDGVIENRSAHLLQEYSDACSHGMPVWTEGELREALVVVDRLGFDAHLHAIGDAGVRTALNAIEHVIEVNGRRDHRTVIAHAQLVDAADLHRFAELGVIVCFQPMWATTDSAMLHLTLPRIGEERGAQQYRIQSVIASGARVSFGSDWPVSSASVLEGMRTAVTRQGPDRLPAAGFIPEERITRADALKAATEGVAYQARADDRRGTLLPGRVADLVWLSGDPLTASASARDGIIVRGTWLAGHRTHGS